jgi:hypothetical protein
VSNAGFIEFREPDYLYQLAGSKRLALKSSLRLSVDCCPDGPS